MKKGFSLVELSIVLVIIGLIIGGIIVGQSMVRSAKIQAVISDFAKYKEAAINFRAKYYYWPGDMPNAYDYWGGTVGCTNDNVNLVSTGCNGYGAGILNYGTPFYEIVHATQFLALAGFIHGTYTGIPGPSPYYLTAQNSIPQPMASDAPTSGSAFPNYIYNNDPYGHHKVTFEIDGGFDSGGLGALKTADAYAIDQKIDDGHALTGLINTGVLKAGSCINSGDYDITNTTERCALFEYLE